MGSGRRRTFQRLGGVTLVELMVVFFIVGLLLTLVRPNLGGISARWRLRSAAQQVESIVLWARSAAAVRNSPVQILYDVPAGNFRVRVDGTVLCRRALPDGTRFERVRFGSEIVERDIAACRAFPDGTVDSHVVVLADRSDRRVRLVFSRLLGEAQYEDAWDE